MRRAGSTGRAWHTGRTVRALALLLAGASVLGLAWLLWPPSPVAVQALGASASAPAGGAAQASAPVEQGRYLATVGNCMGCHTARGGAPYAGGRAIPTPFGNVYSSNLTPHASGLGDWTADDFWRAMHHGQSRDGRWLYPAFPYPNTTHVSRADSDAIHAYLRTLAPVDAPARPHELRWPYRTQAALKVWRALYFRPADPADIAALPRGDYLIQGLAHCSACHAPRNALGASGNLLDLAGGLMPVQNWYAPSLHDPREAGMQGWPVQAVVAFFRDGVSHDRAHPAWASGPMAEVVRGSTQHWREDDLLALAQTLRALPVATRTGAPAIGAAAGAMEGRPAERLTGGDTPGAALYRRHCADCHGAQGEGVAGAYPALAGNRAVTLPLSANLVQVVLHGGFGPSTAGRPRPFGMPPFQLRLQDEEIAALLTHLRRSWGHAASAVSALDVQQWRGDTLPH